MKSVLVYGMPVHSIDDSIYSGLYGNATRAVGLAYNFALNGRCTGLIVEDDFDLKATLAFPDKLFFERKSSLYDIAKKYDVLLVACTNIESFEVIFGQDPYIDHPCKVYACCFDINQKIDVTRFRLGTKAITFNNSIQSELWEKRKTNISSYVIPYGVNDLEYVDQAIDDVSEPRAIWIGEFRRADMLTRLFRFARANPSCPVNVVTRKIFDSNIPAGQHGSVTNPYADFTEATPENHFETIVEQVTGEKIPLNIRYLGVREGENASLLGSHTIGLDFSRFPSQTHDNTKIMDYLRSGLFVVCDVGTPSYRFVEEMGHGVVVPPNCSEEDLRIACDKVSGQISKRRRLDVAERMKKKYGWKITAERYSKIIDMYTPDLEPACPFCKGKARPVYKMAGYYVCKCRVCSTGQAAPMPCDKELQEFYKGFLFGADINNLKTILTSGSNLFSLLGLQKNGKLKMLDVGGGGGFYAKAFEVSGFGESTYVDLDSDACDFARGKIGLANVLNQDAAKLDAGDHRYDFVMCRHLIEHLVNPADFILKLTGILAEGGVLLIVCPNGDSLEYFAYPQLNLKERLRKIQTASGLSKFAVNLKFLSGQMLHGIDPPRHLWAISRKGMRRFLEANHIQAEIDTFSLTDPVYSPYYSPRTFAQKICSLVGDTFTSKIAGGTHLSVVIRKPLTTEDENDV
jgi:2-polyprenyl-3-methyl-5-hydroxy-6-metoxy-1,4-benzoquinol methylase/glycosyltransferase involved in cell wall biosynthesis